MDTTAAHPLEIHVILQRIFYHCTVEDLKVCRQVCKLWQYCSQTSWLSSAVVPLVSARDAPIRKVTKFLDFVEDPVNNYSESPFVGYSINDDNQRFWNLCGPTVKYLELCWTEFQSVDAFRDAIFRRCPNMEELVLRHVEVNGAPKWGFKEPSQLEKPKFGENRNMKSLTLLISGQQPLGLSWMEMLSHFPCLVSLKMRGDQPSGFFSSFSLIREQDPTKLKLEHLDTQGIERGEFPGHKELLQNKDFSFKSLTIRLSESDTEEDLRTILSIHKSSLKKLDLYKDSGAQMNPMKIFPLCGTLEKLQELVLHSRAFTSYGFLMFMPNLKRLELAYSGEDRHRRFENDGMDDVRLNHCKELKVGSKMWRISEDEIRFLLTLLPNVDRLVKLPRS